MSQINLKSITGITSITTPAGVDNQFTLHNNNTTEAVKLDNAGNFHINNQLAVTGVSTFTGNIDAVRYGFSADTNTYITNNQPDSIEMTTGGVERFELKATNSGNSTVLTISDDGNHGDVYGGTGIVVHGSSGARIKFAQNSLGYGIAAGFEVGAYDGGAYLINREPQDIFVSIAPNHSSNPSELLRIKSNGRVGINEDTPSAQLDVRTDEDPASGLISFIRNNTANGNGAFYGMDVNSVGNWSLGIPDNTDAFTIVDGEGNSGAEKLRITSSGHISQGGGAEPSSSNGSVALKYGIKSNANNVIIGETTSSSNGVGLHLESRQTGRGGNARFAQIGLKNDAGGGGQLSFFTAASGADVTEKMNISSSGVIEAKSNSIRFYSSGSNPSSPQNGDTYYNTTDNALKCYVNGTWLNAAGEGNIVSSGTTAVYTVGGQKYLSHAITSSGIVTVSGNTMEVDYLIIAGGGGGGCLGGGGGAGGALTGTGKQLNPGTYSVTVGAGGLNGGDNVPGATGGNTTAFGFTALGGGGGGSHDGGNISAAGTNGGSGGGGSDNNNSYGPGSGTSGQGNNGGNGIGVYSDGGGVRRGGGGGGGAGAVGKNFNVLDNGNYGNGGIGLQNAYETGSNNYYAGGGGRAAYGGTNNHAGDGGHGGGGGGSRSGGGSGNPGDAGLASANSRQGSAGQETGSSVSGGSGGVNTGGGGGCNAWSQSGGASGGSGIIIIRYKIAS